MGLAAVLVGFNSFFHLAPATMPDQIVPIAYTDLDSALQSVRETFNEFAAHNQAEPLTGAMLSIHLTEIFLGIFIGSVTFTGSIVAFGKLHGVMASKPLMLPHRHKLNLAAVVFCFLLLLQFLNSETNVTALVIMTLIALAFGWHLVASIGGADMPVVVSIAELLLRLGSGPQLVLCYQTTS